MFSIGSIRLWINVMAVMGNGGMSPKTIPVVISQSVIPLSGKRWPVERIFQAKRFQFRGSKYILRSSLGIDSEGVCN